MRKFSKVSVPKKGHRRIDYELLKKLWNEGKTTRQIAEQVGTSRCYVSVLGRMLGLQPRKRGVYGIRLKMEAEQRVFSWLQKNGGFAELKKAPVNANVTTRLIRERKIIKVYLSLKKGLGGYRRFTQFHIFKKDFVEKVFVCSDRTAVVRLFCKVLLKPKDRHVKYILTHYLKKHLTEAERIAVLWNLGLRDWSRHSKIIKSSIQIDGIVMPKRRK